MHQTFLACEVRQPPTTEDGRSLAPYVGDAETNGCYCATARVTANTYGWYVECDRS
ncbi:MAG: hypothetical protein KME38_25475 [Spirirestis rafaelensis WJT71-NPBG6]|nr:hypothetical protein [Spirirestis rafaelensis WJT71-NPBG6]